MQTESQSPTRVEGSARNGSLRVWTEGPACLRKGKQPSDTASLHPVSLPRNSKTVMDVEWPRHPGPLGDDGGDGWCVGEGRGSGRKHPCPERPPLGSHSTCSLLC